MPDFHVASTMNGDRMIVALAGEVDLRVRDELQRSLLAAVDAAARVLVDLTAVRFLDSSGLHALVTAHQTAQERGRSVYAANATGTVATILEITGIDELLRPPPNDGRRTHDPGTDTDTHAHIDPDG